MDFAPKENLMAGSIYSLPNKALRICLILGGFKFLCTLLALLVFTRFTPLLDAEQYLSGAYLEHGSLRTLLVQKLVLILAKFGSDLIVHFVFGLLSLLGFFYYYLKGGTRWQLCLFLLLPSSFIWTSVIGKEAIFYGAFTLSLVIWSQFVHRRCKTLDIVILLAAVIVCMLLRPHYGLSVIWLFVSVALIDKVNNKAWIWLSLLAFVSCILFSIYVWETMLYHAFYGIDPNARASRFVYFGMDQLTGDGFEKYKALLPLGAILGIVGPTPIEVFERPLLTPFFLEGVLILIFPAAIYVYSKTQFFLDQERFRKIFWMCLVPVIVALIVVHAPWGLLNPGSATRWRVNFEAIFHIAPILLLYSFLDNKYDENNSFSS